jgi:hypothetical protein
MNIILNTLWLIRTAKYVLFWIFLWQLKEYHIPRFIDHFRTEKGKKIITNPLLSVKVLLLLLLAFNPETFSICFSVTFLIYVAETLIFAKQIWQKSAKKPVKTFKTLLLAFLSFAVFATVYFNPNFRSKSVVLAVDRRHFNANNRICNSFDYPAVFRAGKNQYFAKSGQKNIRT